MRFSSPTRLAPADNTTASHTKETKEAVVLTKEQTYMPTGVDADLVAALEASPAHGDGRGLLLDFPGHAPVELPTALA